MKRLSCSILLLLITTNLWGQKSIIDLLETQVRDTTLRPDSLARLYKQLTRFYVGQHAYQDAIRATQKQLQLVQKGSEKAKIAAAYFNLASLYRTVSNHKLALKYGHQSLEYYQQQYGKIHQEPTSVERFLAQTYYLQKDIKNALIWSQKAIDHYQQLEEEFPLERLNLQILLGSIYYEKTEYIQAQYIFERALQYYQKYADKIPRNLLARIYNNLASIKDTQQLIAQALSYYQKAENILVQLYGDNHVALVTIYHNIGLAHHHLSDYPKAIGYHQKNLRILEKTYGQSHSKIARTQTHLGGAYYLLDQLDSAQYYINSSIRNYQQLLGSNTVEIIPSLWRLANIHKEKGAYQKAEKILQRVLQIQQKKFGKQHLVLAQLYRDRSKLCEQKKDYQQAIHWIHKAQDANQKATYILSPLQMLDFYAKELDYYIAIQDWNKIPIDEILNKSQQIATDLLQGFILPSDYSFLTKNLRKICENGLFIYHQIQQQNPDIRHTEKALSLIEINKGLLLQKEWNKNRNIKMLSSTQKEEYRQLKAALQKAEKDWQKAQIKNDSIAIIPYQTRLYDHKKALDDWQQNYLPNYKTKVRSPKLSQLQRQINQEEQVWNYFYGNEHIYAVIIEQDTAVLYQIDTSVRTALDSFFVRLYDLRPAKQNIRKAAKNYTYWSTKLFQQLFPRSIKNNLYILPDAQLHALPFGALTTDTLTSYQGFHHLPYLIHQSAISTSYSLQLWQQQQFESPTVNNDSILACAPKYKVDLHLTYATKELDFLKKNYQGHFLSEQIRKDDLNNYFQQEWNIIHLAMHGRANQQKYAVPTLLLDDSTMLYAHEIAQHQFKTNLVVLSACQTSVGYWQEGEGVWNMARAFVAAGSPAVLATYWQINDQYSHQILQNFYQQLPHQNKAIALQLAQQKHLQKASNFQAHPFFWAGFSLMGNTQALVLENSSHSLGRWLLFLLFVLGALGYYYKK